MNIHEAMLQPIAAFVYCNRQATAGRRRQKTEISTRQPAPAQMGRVQLKLFYDGTTREIE